MLYYVEILRKIFIYFVDSFSISGPSGGTPVICGTNDVSIGTTNVTDENGNVYIIMYSNIQTVIYINIHSDLSIYLGTTYDSRHRRFHLCHSQFCHRRRK